MNIEGCDLLHAAARTHPDAPALLTPTEAVSYEAFDRRVQALADRLRSGRIDRGTRVAFYLPRDAFCAHLLPALWRIGAVACPLSTRRPPATLAPLLEQVAATHLITGDEAAARAVSQTVQVVRRAMLDRGGEAQPVPDAWDLDDPATILFTSGSTGTSKGALHTLGNHYFSAKGSSENILLAPGDRWLLSLPLYHVGGIAILFRCLLAGATVVLAAPGAPVGEVLARRRITHVSMVPTQLRRFLQEGQAAPEHLRAVLLGGSTLPPALVAEAHERGIPLYTSYGLTEMASQVTTTPPDAALETLCTAGGVLSYRHVSIAPDGEILVRGRTRFQGYVAGRCVEQPFDADGWFRTGDRGRFDGAGRLHLHGRTDHLFISGGENVQPEEIEAALADLDGVAQAVVVPVPDETFGRRPVAFVRPTDGPLPGDLAARLARTLPRFKVPDAFYPWPEEKTATSLKMDRAFFREKALRRQSSSI